MNEKRFREIYEQYYRLVKSVAFSVLNDYDFAEDVSQEVFLLFSQKVETLKEESNDSLCSRFAKFCIKFYLCVLLYPHIHSTAFST